MLKYDIERLLSDIQTLLANNLNTKIGSINTEKADSITLSTVNAAAYFQDLNGKQVNYDPFILYCVENIATQSIRGASIENVTVSVVLVLADYGEDINVYNRMLRYGRALKEVFEENFTLAQNQANLEIQSLLPVYFQALNSSEYYRAVGVNIVTSIG